MASYTENYNLKKPERTDFYSVQDFNDNADIIDTALDDKLNKDFSNVSSGVVPIANGGTGATTAADALNNLGVTTALSNKVDKDLSNVTGTLPITKGGTGATTAAQALINLGVENNYKLLGNNGLLSNQDVLSYITSLEEPQCGFFRTEDCTGTPDDTTRWWRFNLAVNKGAKVLFAYRVSDYTNATCDIWVNQRWYVNTADIWCGWQKIPKYGGRGEFMALELSTTTPFIDFHYNSSTEDYTARIIQTGLNVLQFSNTYPYANGTLDVQVNGKTVSTTANSSTSGATYVTSSTPSYARNNDLWAW